MPGFKTFCVSLLMVSMMSAQATGLVIGAGGSVSLGNGQLHLNCGDLKVLGQFNMNTGLTDATHDVIISGSGVLTGDSGTIKFGNDWNNSGVLNANSSQVMLVDKCGDGSSAFTESNEFYNLTMQTATGKRVVLEQGSTQTVLNNLALQGAPGNLLTLRSSVNGEVTYIMLNADGSQFIDYVDVMDNWAEIPGQHLAPGPAQAFNSVDSGNNFRWFNNVLNAIIPTLSGWGMLLLMIALIVSAIPMRRRVFKPKPWDRVDRQTAK